MYRLLILVLLFVVLAITAFRDEYYADDYEDYHRLRGTTPTPPTLRRCVFKTLHKMHFDGYCDRIASNDFRTYCNTRPRMYILLHNGRRHYESEQNCNYMYLFQECRNTVVYHGDFVQGVCDNDGKCLGDTYMLENAYGCGGTEQYLNLTLARVSAVIRMGRQ